MKRKWGNIMNKKFDVIVFNDENVSLEVNFDKDNDTVWLSQNEMATLFGVDRTRIVRHISNIYKDGELDEMSTSAENAQVRLEGNRKISRSIKIYNLDMIISVGYRVNSKKGIIFRKWANTILKKYLVEGYAVNEKRLNYLEKQINLISIASRLDDKLISDEGNKILQTIIDYNKALNLLDDYDHQTLKKPDGTIGCYRITYEECRKIIDSMKFDSKIFGVEKDGSFNSSINAIYQSAFSEDVYKTVEEKAANLLYFITKNHSFVDGNKRIAASIFLYFLDRNNILYLDGAKRLQDATLVAITILIAESKPEEKEIIIDLIMNFLV